MLVEQGITFAQPVQSVMNAQCYDGEIVWMFTGPTEGPAWLASVPEGAINPAIKRARKLAAKVTARR